MSSYENLLQDFSVKGAETLIFEDETVVPPFGINGS
jgi:hypothetical protein